MRAIRPLGLAAAVLATFLAASGCNADDGRSEGGEVVITCTTCAGGSDPFLQYRHEVAEAFNKKFAGKYRIDMLENVVGEGAELQQAYQRLAVAGDLPDLFVHTAAPLKGYDEVQPLMDFSSFLEDDSEFADPFYDGIFNLLTLDDGRIIGVPEQRDVVGVYYNTSILEAAGVSEPPASWDEFLSDAEAVKANGAIPVAADGLFVTQIWLSHLIGTQEGGADYLNSGDLLEGGFADNELWVNAIEYLRDLHANGLVNEDAFTGDFQSASVPFLSGEAAAITNGPWYTGDLAGDAATRGLADDTVYVPAPDDGVVVYGGDAGWASAAEEPEKQEAVWEFIKFAYGFDEQFNRTLATGSFGPIKGEFTDDQRQQLSSLAVGLVEAAADTPNAYFSVISLMPQPFQDAWSNYWPAYVQEGIDTETFLTHLSDSLTS